MRERCRCGDRLRGRWLPGLWSFFQLEFNFSRLTTAYPAAVGRVVDEPWESVSGWSSREWRPIALNRTRRPMNRPDTLVDHLDLVSNKRVFVTRFLIAITAK